MMKYFSERAAAAARLAPGLLGLLIAAGLAACSLSPSAPPPRPRPAPVVPTPEQLASPAYEPVRWSHLPGWSSDEVKEAWPAFLKSCRSLRFRADWTQACTAADKVDGKSSRAVRAYFDRYFEPYAVVNPMAGSRSHPTGTMASGSS